MALVIMALVVHSYTFIKTIKYEGRTIHIPVGMLKSNPEEEDSFVTTDVV